MAIYHLSAKPISRAKGRTATAAATYRAGESITDERTGEVHDYTLTTSSCDGCTCRLECMNAVSTSPKVKSWSALFFGLFCTGLAFWSWSKSGALHHLIAGFGFACWAVAWSQLKLSFKAPLREIFGSGEPLSPVMSALTLGGFLLVLASQILNWF